MDKIGLLMIVASGVLIIAVLITWAAYEEWYDRKGLPMDVANTRIARWLGVSCVGLLIVGVLIHACSG